MHQSRVSPQELFCIELGTILYLSDITPAIEEDVAQFFLWKSDFFIPLQYTKITNNQNQIIN